MAFITITSPSNFCQYKMRANYYRLGRLLQSGANSINRLTKYVYSGRVIMILKSRFFAIS